MPVETGALTARDLQVLANLVRQAIRKEERDRARPGQAEKRWAAIARGGRDAGLYALDRLRDLEEKLSAMLAAAAP
jgi:hypothetical protein